LPEEDVKASSLKRLELSRLNALTPDNVERHSSPSLASSITHFHHDLDDNPSNQLATSYKDNNKQTTHLHSSLIASSATDFSAIEIILLQRLY
jgi:hypothetical protein